MHYSDGRDAEHTVRQAEALYQEWQAQAVVGWDPSRFEPAVVSLIFSEEARQRAA